MGNINIRKATFGGLVLAATGLLLYSWFMPLWGLDIQMLRSDAVLVRSWGEQVLLGPYAAKFDIPSMPAFFAPLMWAYLGIIVVLLFSSLLVKERTFDIGRLRLSVPQLMIGGVGFAHLVFAAVLPIVITIKLGQFDADSNGVTVPLQGTVFLDFGDPLASPVTSSLRLGYWLAWGTGTVLVVLALLRNKIIGRG